VTPYDIINNTGKEIDYNKLIVKFGCFNITPPLLERMNKLTGGDLHHYLTR
jgi:hypothetical protein